MKNETVSSIRYDLTCGIIKDPDQPAHLHSLITDFWLGMVQVAKGPLSTQVEN